MHFKLYRLVSIDGEFCWSGNLEKIDPYSQPRLRANIGDGDSSSYNNLVESNPYTGIASVRKEECLGHVQKRLKKRLRKDSKGFMGLPESKADRIAHMYALVIVQNRGQSPQTSIMLFRPSASQQ